MAKTAELVVVEEVTFVLTSGMWIAALVIDSETDPGILTRMQDMGVRMIVPG